MSIIPKAITRSISRSILKTKRNSPHIFFGLGVAGVIGGTVLACRATLKLDKTLSDIKEDVSQVKSMGEESEKRGTAYYKEDYHRDLSYVYTKGGLSIARLYGPAAVVGSVSIAMLTGSHVQMTRRNAALTAALGSIMKTFDQYRERVRENVGEEQEFDIYNNIKTEEVTDENGDTKKVKSFDRHDRLSAYARVFDDTNSNWQNNAELNRIFVECQENYYNDILKSRGYVFLNDVYDSLGVPRSSVGQLVGWVLNGDGDNYIDFGLDMKWNQDVTSGKQRDIVLDFNVDGVVYDKI